MFIFCCAESWVFLAIWAGFEGWFGGGRSEASWDLIQERQVCEDGKKTASVFDCLFLILLPVCILRPILVIILSRMQVPFAASILELKRAAQSST